MCHDRASSAAGNRQGGSQGLALCLHVSLILYDEGVLDRWAGLADLSPALIVVLLEIVNNIRGWHALRRLQLHQFINASAGEGKVEGGALLMACSDLKTCLLAGAFKAVQDIARQTCLSYGNTTAKAT